MELLNVAVVVDWIKI